MKIRKEGLLKCPFPTKRMKTLSSTFLSGGRGRKATKESLQGQRAEESDSTHLFAMMEALHIVVTKIHALLEMRSSRLIDMGVIMGKESEIH